MASKIEIKIVRDDAGLIRVDIHNEQEESAELLLGILELGRIVLIKKLTENLQEVQVD